MRLLSKEKRIQLDALCDGIQKAIVTAVKRDFNNKDIVFCEIDPDKQEMKVYVRKNVVSEISDPDCDLLPEQAQPYKNGAVPGDIVEIPLETRDVSRIAADKGKHVLRSRFEIAYDKKHALLTPFANVELYNSWGIEKIRYTLGTDINLTKQHTLTAFYRFSDAKNVSADDYDPDMHYIGVGYKFKF